MTAMAKHSIKMATFAAGCFWGVEHEFSKVDGVINTTTGYTGGHFKSPSYEDVCTGKTGHAEAVQVEYDPKKISYEDLLDVFWRIHDPTQLNRQGFDIGTQYRSTIFYHNGEQNKAAIASKEKLEKSGKYKKLIVTEIVPASIFYEAEEYHQKYWLKNKNYVCHV